MFFRENVKRNVRRVLFFVFIIKFFGNIKCSSAINALLQIPYEYNLNIEQMNVNYYNVIKNSKQYKWHK